MAITGSVVFKVPIYTKVNGKEIELGTIEIPLELVPAQ